MGLLSRHHWSKACFQHQSFWLRCLRLDRWRNAKLHFPRSDVSLPSSLLITYVIDVFRVAIYSACAGGGYILDATNFLEFLPTTYAWLVTFMAVWWAVGYTVTGLLAWAFMSNYSCAPDATPATCLRSENMGWRYLHFTCGALVLVMALLRVTVIRMTQTPR